MPGTAIVLAAGASTRMGSQKVVLPYNGKTVIRHIVDELAAVGLNEIVVVVGNRAQNVRDALTDSSAIITENSHFEEGMLSSVRVGIRAASTQNDHALICLGDQPALRSGLVQVLIEEAARSPKTIIVPRYNELRGHPMVVPRCFWNEVLDRYDEVGLRGLLREHSASVQEFSVEEEWVLDDMDRPEDYARELKRLEESDQH